MNQHGIQCKDVSLIRSLLPESSDRLLDVGCGPISSDYPYADKASRVTCVDWNLHASGSLPPHIECVDGDFTSVDLAPGTYDSIIAADVFEHISLEQEPLFVKKCISSLRPGGSMVVSGASPGHIRMPRSLSGRSPQSIACSPVCIYIRISITAAVIFEKGTSITRCRN